MKSIDRRRGAEVLIQETLKKHRYIAVFIWKAHPLYPFLLLLNRDEYHDRPTDPLAWWDGGNEMQILGGRDGVAGGTWLTCSRDGRLAFLTNVRELHSFPQAKSRGHLPVRFLESKKNTMEFAEEVSREADQYNGFNLIMANLCSMNMVYVSNRPKEDNIYLTKAQQLRHDFKDLLDIYGQGAFPINEMAEKLMRDTLKDDESLLPCIFPPEWEYHLSSIFVEAETPKGRYGTRSTSALSVKTSGEVNFYARHLENNTWRQ